MSEEEEELDEDDEEDDEEEEDEDTSLDRSILCSLLACPGGTTGAFGCVGNAALWGADPDEDDDEDEEDEDDDEDAISAIFAST